eukprot:2212369-Prymnesium_polylepis.1
MLLGAMRFLPWKAGRGKLRWATERNRLREAVGVRWATIVCVQGSVLPKCELHLTATRDAGSRR